jgi:hypothetical protein
MTFATKNQLSNNQQVANGASHKRRMSIFFVKYKHDDFTHVCMDEFMLLHLQL